MYEPPDGREHVTVQLSPADFDGLLWELAQSQSRHVVSGDHGAAHRVGWLLTVLREYAITYRPSMPRPQLTGDTRVGRRRRRSL
jgi:hypothetical protein